VVFAITYIYVLKSDDEFSHRYNVSNQIVLHKTQNCLQSFVM